MEITDEMLERFRKVYKEFDGDFYESWKAALQDYEDRRPKDGFTLDQVREAVTRIMDTRLAELVCNCLALKPKTLEERVTLCTDGCGWRVSVDGKMLFDVPCPREMAVLIRAGKIAEMKEADNG